MDLVKQWGIILSSLGPGPGGTGVPSPKSPPKGNKNDARRVEGRVWGSLSRKKNGESRRRRIDLLRRIPQRGKGATHNDGGTKE